jgi:curved DNA-binding protein CbpA
MIRAMAELPEPIAQGDLAKTPFAHLLLYIERKQLTGTLVVWSAEGEGPQERVLFGEGRPHAARFSRPAPRLERGLLPLFRRARGPYAFYGGVDLVGSGEGRKEGRVALPALIAASLRGSARDEVVEAVLKRFGDSPVRLVPGVALGDFELLGEERAFIDVLRAGPAPVGRLLELAAQPGQMPARLLYLLTIYQALELYVPSPLSEAPPVAAGPPSEANLPLPSLDSITPPAEAAARRAPTAPPASSVRPSSSGRLSSVPRPSLPPHAADDTPEGVPDAPHGLSDEDLAFWNEVARRVAAIDGQNYFEILGVDEAMEPADIHKHYFSLVRVWHPDRLQGDLELLRPHVERVFRLMTEAEATLTNTRKRAHYLETVDEGGGTPAADRRLGRIVQAAMDFRKVEVLIRRGKWVEALEAIDEVLELHDEEADYHAARGWVTFQLHGATDEALPFILQSLEKAVEINPESDTAHYYLGMVIKQTGDLDEAFYHFRRAGQINDRHLDAKREIRLARMRGAKARSRRPSRGPSQHPRTTGRPTKPPSKEQASFFSRLFGSGKKK